MSRWAIRHIHSWHVAGPTFIIRWLGYDIPSGHLTGVAITEQVSAKVSLSSTVRTGSMALSLADVNLANLERVQAELYKQYQEVTLRFRRGRPEGSIYFCVCAVRRF
ncbi:hypothetical protein BJX68DRAFT_117065 [Aspergillus pseudodeflectus]|uniref:Uncharacterized protein n=1 Tax=Aspergillus pseudodeflectus TaxID=176178 RepID=A0ABR4L806_9EURO